MTDVALGDCAVLISTCDNYADIWKPFFTLFHKFWPDNPFPVYINSETLDCHDDRVTTTTLKARVGISWTRRLKEALERIDANYIVFMLDDFFLYDEVDTARIEECVSYMRKDSEIAAIYFTWLGAQMVMEECALPGLEKCSHNGKSKLNITLTLWRKDAFIYYLDRDESAWEFEANALVRSLDRNDTFYSFSKNTSIAIPYNFTRYGLFAGKWFRDTVGLFEKQGIMHDFSTRGFFEEYETGLIPYVVQQIKMDSYLVPCYALTRDNPRINTDKIVEDGHFSQSYDVTGARTAATWYPSLWYGYAIKEFKCTITFQSGRIEILNAQDVFGNFSLYRDAMYFLRPGVFVYIFPKLKQEMLSVTIEGSMNKHLDREDLMTAYSMDVKSAPSGLRGLLSASGIYAEPLLVPETFTSFRIYSRLCFKYNGAYDEKNAILDGEDRFPRQFFQSYKIDKSAENIVRWDIGGSFGGYAIEDLQVKMIYGSSASQILEPQHIKGDGVSIDRYWVFLSPTDHLLFSLPDERPDEIRISGTVMAPMPRRVLRAVIYAEDLQSKADKAGDDNKANENGGNTEKIYKKSKRNNRMYLNEARFIMARAKRGIKKYGVFGVVKEVAKRLFR